MSCVCVFAVLCSYAVAVIIWPAIGELVPGCSAIGGGGSGGQIAERVLEVES